jgi:hypothetical protein
LVDALDLVFSFCLFLTAKCMLFFSLLLLETSEVDERGVPACTAPVPWAAGSDMNGCRPESLQTALPSGEEEVVMSFVALGGAPAPLRHIGSPL